MKTIYRISEAFSMQPIDLKIGTSFHTNEKRGETPPIIKEFEECQIKLDGQLIDYIRGIDEEGNTLFLYRSSTVNIQYYETRRIT